MSPPLERRLQLFTGKGGTGKTTLVAALGLAHAARGRRPLLLELGHRASLAPVLGAGAIDHQVREVVPGVFATNLDPREAVRALVERALPTRVTGRLLRSGPVRVFLDAAPGVVEVATLDRIRHLVDETDFDPVLVDADATGHTRMLFALHDVLASLGVRGAIATLLDRVTGLFASPEIAATHLTTLPTSLALEETLELWRELRATGQVALGHALVNRVEGGEAEDFDEGELASRERSLATDPALASAVALLRVDAERWARASTVRDRLRDHGAEPRLVAEIDAPVLDRDHLREIGLRLLERRAS